MRLRQGSCAFAVLALLAVTACNRPSGPSATTRATTRPTTPATDPGGTDVVRRTITVDDPQVGRLTFDALAAGAPEAAAQGRLVLLLHGFPQTGEAYRPILGRLAAAGYYAVAPTQRGFSAGARPPAVEDYALARTTADALGMADALGAGDFHLVGHDWGGAVAWRVAASAPGRLRSLVVLSTPHPDAFADAFAAPGSDQPRRSAYMQAFRAPGAENTLARSFTTMFTATGLPAAYARTYAEVLGEPQALGAALNWYRANPTPPTRVGPVTVRTRYVWGTDDMALGRQAAEGTARYVPADRFRFQVVEGGSHWLPETRADLVAAAILEHLAG